MLSDKTILPSELRFLLVFVPEDDSTVILQHFCNYLPFDTRSFPEDLKFSAPPLWEPENL